MQAFEFSCPTKIICGEDSLHKLSGELTDRKVSLPLIVTDANLVSLGIAERALEPLREAGIAYRMFDQVPPDSSLDVVNAVAQLYRTEGCDGFVAIGGGSVIDTVKGAAASISAGGEDFARLQGSEILHEELPPFIAIPTTAGTGSEVTLVAVVADTQAHAKLSYTSYRLVPQCALLDPTLTTSLPPKLTATTAIDALTHAIEAYTSIQKNPVSDALACGAIDLICCNIDEACKNPENRDARTSLALGSCMAGAAFSNAMVGLVHAIGHSLGGLAHVPHGQAMTILLPHCVHFNNQNGYHAGLYGQLLPYLDRTAPAFHDPLEADRAFEAALFQINSHLHEAYGVPIVLADAHVDHDSLAAIAHQARYDGAALYNRQEITEETALEILEASYR